MQVLAQLQRMMDTQDDVALLKRASTMMTALQAAEQVPSGPSEANRQLCAVLAGPDAYSTGLQRLLSSSW